MFLTPAHAQIAAAEQRSRHACDVSALKQIAMLVDANHARAMRREELRQMEAEGRYTPAEIAVEMNHNLLSAVDAERQIKDLNAGLFNEWARERVQTTAAIAMGAAATRTALRLKSHARRERRLMSRKAAEKAIGAAKRAERAAQN